MVRVLPPSSVRTHNSENDDGRSLVRTHKDERRRTMVQIWMLAPLGPDTHGAGTCKTRSRNQRLNILLALPIMMLTMGRPREFGTNSPGRRELRENDGMYRRRLKDGRVTALFPQDIAKQLDRAGLHMIEDLTVDNRSSGRSLRNQCNRLYSRTPARTLHQL